MADSQGTRLTDKDERAAKFAEAPQPEKRDAGVLNLEEYEAQESEKETKKLESFAEKVREPLVVASGVFPLDLVPDQVIVELHQVTIIHRDLLMKEDIITIPTIDIEEVTYSATIFSATLIIKPAGKDEVKVKHLHTDQASEAHKIINGMVECNKANIDLAKVDVETARESIKKLGRIAPVF